MPIAGELPIEEECPACKTEIPFRDIRTAACNNGHPWSESPKFCFPQHFYLLARKQTSSMLDHHTRTWNFSGTNMPWMHAQGVFPCSVGFRWSPTGDRGEPVDSRGPSSCDPMSVLWEPFCVLAVVPFASFRKFSSSFARVSQCYDVTD